ncbi:UNVERIFIED_ORG: formate hydrogenlyase subunit 3/multisubunit Na+/H+ antiporter MnhD subunit [Xanthomonas axonopodis]
MNHLLILPILIPMLGASASLFVEHRRYGPRVQRSVAWVSIALLAAAVIALFARAADGQILVYLLGDWPARIGIVLMGDRLSAWMLLTTLILGSACLLHACAGWDRRAPHFHALFQFQLMGLNGAFLTGDIFNLFVFFEVMLIASYGLLLSGGRGLQMRVGLHYVVFNVCASTLFLIALGLLFGVFGTLNMAELSQRIADPPAQDVPLAKATLGLLLLVFCSKAALLPLYLWLPETYSRAPAAVAALFAIMTKVGLYGVLRVSSLWFGAGALHGFGRHALLWLGIATLLMARVRGDGRIAAAGDGVVPGGIFGSDLVHRVFAGRCRRAGRGAVLPAAQQLCGRCIVHDLRPDPSPPRQCQRPQGSGGAAARASHSGHDVHDCRGRGGRVAAAVRISGQGRIAATRA